MQGKGATKVDQVGLFPHGDNDGILELLARR